MSTIDKYITESGGKVTPILQEIDATSKKILGIAKKLMNKKYDGSRKLMNISYDDLYYKYYEKK